MGDELTPRELGLLAGTRWAEGARAAGDERVRMVADGDIGPKLIEEVLALGFRERLDEFADPAAAEEEFWQGFEHGVRSFVVEDLARVSGLN
jgi:hypothetical protein